MENRHFSLSVYFVRPRSLWDPYAWAIRLFIWAPYCHTAIGFSNKIFEAVGDGATWSTLKRFNAKNKTIALFEIELSQAQHVKLLSLCKRIEKTPYDWRAIVNLAFYKLGLRPIYPDNGRKYLFCSELAFVILQDLGLLPEGQKPDYMDPKRFLRYLEKANDPAIIRIM